MRKILIIITTAFVPYGGLTTAIMNYYKYMTKEQLQLDFASTNEPEDNMLMNYIASCGSRYYCLGDRKKHPIDYFRALLLLLQKSKYDAIHVNGNSSTMLLELFAAKIASVPVRIAHCHTNRSNYNLLHVLLKIPFKHSYTKAIAVSQEAGKWLFKNDFVILHNAINPMDYSFDENIRIEMRDQLGLDDAFVIGNVGKLYDAKNHSFLLDIFSELKKQMPNTKLVIVGGGELEENLKRKARNQGIIEDVTFLGMRNDIPRILQAFDYFVFPSKYEGFGLALIEAQAAGLNCVASDMVPQSTNVTGSVKYLGLTVSSEVWANTIICSKECDRHKLCKQSLSSFLSKGFDIRSEADKLIKLYSDQEG